MNIEAFFKVTYGLYIVSAGNSAHKNGFVSNTVFQVTAEPPRFAACCNKNNHTADVIGDCGSFSVSVLQKNCSSDLIGLFGYKSGRDTDKFSGTAYITGELGTPIVVQDTIAWFECKVENTIDVGTHLIFIGSIINNAVLDGSLEPLTYSHYRDVKKGVAPKNAPTYIDKSKFEAPAIVPVSSKPMDKYECQVCGLVYDPAAGDPDGGIAPGTAFEDIPDNWVCPVCGTGKTDFVKISS